MSGHEKKARGVRVTGKSPIATPPRVALSGRTKTEIPEDSASTKSTADGNGSDNEDADSDAKDKKIAELQREMTTMMEEFERELTQLSKKMMDESETATFWQQKHSTLNQTFLKTDTDLRLLRQEVNSFQQSREERDRDIKTRISSLMLDRDAFREAYNDSMADLRAKDDMIKALQGQVWGLKSFVSTSSKMDEQVTDEAFGEYMQRLGNSIQNWVITNFRRAKIGMSFSCWSSNPDRHEHLLLWLAILLPLNIM
jgi:chromosome segregation ATPase